MKPRLIAAVHAERDPCGPLSSHYIHEDEERDELEREDLPRPPWLALPPLDAIRR